MKTIKLKLDEIKPYDKNPRKNDDAVEYVAESIKQCGYVAPIIIDENNVILAGHTRYKALKRLGYKEIECVVKDNLTEEQKKKYRILDNKTNEYAEWDYDLLAGELKDLDFEGFDFGWDLEIDEGDDIEIVEDEFDEEEAIPEVPKAKLGDIYQLGDHRLMCGDSTNEANVLALANGNEMDVVVTDPPYNVDYGSKAEAINKYGYKFSDRHIENDKMPDYQFVEFLDKAFHNMNEVLKNGGAFYIWHASITVHEFEEALKLNNLKTRQQLIWIKNALVLGRQDYQWKHEPCLYGWKEGAGHYFVDDRTITTVFDDIPDFNKMSKDEMKELLKQIYSDKVATTIIRENKPAKSPEHPTMKPIKLIATLVKNSSKRGENCMDLFGGSGTTLMACEQLGRKAFLMEYDPKFVDVIITRWEKFTGKKAVKIC